MKEILSEAFIDSYPILPVLFITYLLFEYFERHNHLENVKRLLSRKGLGPFIGAFLGVLPQCGFSVAAAGLYVNNSISLGTMISIFIATSDEAIPILISYPDQIYTLAFVVVGKLMIAFLAGFLIDAVYRPKRNIDHIVTACEDEHDHIIIIALRRTLKIFIFILVTNVIVGALVFWAGEERLSLLLMKDSALQPLIAAIFGFLPNCAASVILTQLFIKGSISLGSFTAGLITNAGLGMLVLMRSKAHRKDAFITAGYMLLVAYICGFILQLW